MKHCPWLQAWTILSGTAMFAIAAQPAVACKPPIIAPPATPEEAEARLQRSIAEAEQYLGKEFAEAEFLAEVDLSSWSETTPNSPFMIGHFRVIKNYKGSLKEGDHFEARIFHLYYNCSNRMSVYPKSGGLLFVNRRDHALVVDRYLSPTDILALKRMNLITRD